MSVTNQELNSCIKSFIELLQENKTYYSRSRRGSIQSYRLSTIYSASQPQFSQSGKCSEHQSVISSQGCCQKIRQLQQLLWAIKTNKTSFKDIQKSAEQMENIILELLRILQAKDLRIKDLEGQILADQQKREEIIKAIDSMDRAEKELWESYNQTTDLCSQLKQENQSLRLNNYNLTLALEECQKDVQFMKKLVLVANENYEKMERKCIRLENQIKILQNFRQSESPRQPLTARNSIITRKPQFSPCVSDKSISKKSISPKVQKKTQINHGKKVKTNTNTSIR